jgi:hypothetical protein
LAVGKALGCWRSHSFLLCVCWFVQQICFERKILQKNPDEL